MYFLANFFRIKLLKDILDICFVLKEHFATLSNQIISELFSVAYAKKKCYNYLYYQEQMSIKANVKKVPNIYFFVNNCSKCIFIKNAQKY